MPICMCILYIRIRQPLDKNSCSRRGLYIAEHVMIISCRLSATLSWES